jgi:uncharacterized protein (TIRG00374 family)
MKPDRRTTLGIIWVLGVLVFVLLLVRIGPGRIWENLSRLTLAGFALLFLLRALYWLFRTLIWRAILAGDGPASGFGHLFVARMAGHAVSYITPSAYLGGEAARTLLVDGVNRKTVLASVVVDTTLEILTTALFTLAGIAFISVRSSLPVSTRLGLTASMIAAIAGLLFLIRRQRRGMFLGLIDFLGRIGLRPRFIEKNRDKIREVDARISDFYARGPRAVGRIFVLNTLLLGLWVAEVHLTIAFLGAPHLTIPKSFLAVTMGAVGLILPTTPASLGTYEAVNLAVFAGLGWSAGLSMSLALVRRSLSLFWAGFGLIAIACRKRNRRI